MPLIALRSLGFRVNYASVKHFILWKDSSGRDCSQVGQGKTHPTMIKRALESLTL